MRKRIVLIALLIITLALTSSCKLIERDMTVVNNRVVLSFNGVTYTRGQVEPLVEQQLDIMEANYLNYGMTMDRTDPDMIDAARESVISGLIYDQIIIQKADELGCSLTEEELAEIEATAETTFQENLAFFRDVLYGGQEVSDEVICADMAIYGYPTSVEATAEALRAEKLEEKLMATTTADITITEDDVQAVYDSELAYQQQDFDSYPAMFETALNSGSPIYYTPEGFRYVKHIFIPYAEADATAIADVADQISAADEGTDLTALNDQLDTLRISAVSAIQPTLDEVQGKLDAGEDFDSLIAQYSKDEASLEEPVKTNGYLMYEASITPLGTGFRDAAMELSIPGDISQPVVTDSGVHYILFVSELTPGVTPLEDVRESVEAQALDTLKYNAYQTISAQWLDEANAEINLDALK